MPLTKVTATGPGDVTHIESLLALLRKYPNSEIGILASPKHSGSGRFPSDVWLDRLHEAVGVNPELRGRFALHACGGYVRDFLTDNAGALLTLLKKYPRTYSRVQINTHGETILTGAPVGTAPHVYLSGILLSIETNLSHFEDMGIEVIFQRDGVNNFIFDLLCGRGRAKNISTLFDLSAGAGILPDSWPSSLDGRKCGYAGGLSPDNVFQQILKIQEVCPGDYWIDAEGRLMADDGYLSLTKVDDYFHNANAWFNRKKCLNGGRDATKTS